MLNLQLGIRWSMTHTAAQPEPQALHPLHLNEKVRHGGSCFLPHCCGTCTTHRLLQGI